ncbi:MAG: URC4/urg3 family protein [Cyanobacteria bacterium P01_A01_bin.123]
MWNPSNSERDAIAYLQSPQAIRDRATHLFELGCADKLVHFRVDLEQLEPAADFVLQVIQSAYPNLDVPFHSRWRHFEVEGQSQLERVATSFAGWSDLDLARMKFDLAITSVLLDAGAGAAWHYVEPNTGKVFTRSEGLAIASFHSFKQGLFSSNPQNPWQADAEGLTALTAKRLAAGFQVSADNPLVGLAGRVELLQKLGQALAAQPSYFGQATPRPGYLVDYLRAQAVGGELSAVTVLQAVLKGLGSIWPGRIAIAGVNLGDVWPHPQLPDTGLGSQLVPFHKLSQWLTYSLLEPLQDLGLTLTDLDQLTGLAEYRNGGLCLDIGLLQPKQPNITTQSHRPESPVIVEWRALTLVLLDQIADTLRQTLNLSPAELPLVKVLQGGTWSAGRQLAQQLRNGLPPIQIESDGTVF